MLDFRPDGPENYLAAATIIIKGNSILIILSYDMCIYEFLKSLIGLWILNSVFSACKQITATSVFGIPHNKLQGVIIM